MTMDYGGFLFLSLVLKRLLCLQSSYLKNTVIYRHFTAISGETKEGTELAARLSST